jgi:hypothetical protein
LCFFEERIRIGLGRLDGQHELPLSVDPAALVLDEQIIGVFRIKAQIGKAGVRKPFADVGNALRNRV